MAANLLITTPFQGLRGTGSFIDGEVPGNYREGILRLNPNGDTPLTGLLSKMASESCDNYQFHWFTENLPTQGGDATGIYTDAALSSPYVSGAVAGDILHVKAAELTIKEIRVGHQVRLRTIDDPMADVSAKVLGRVFNGASSYATVRLLEADKGVSHPLADTDRILISGNINPDGGMPPEAVSYKPVKLSNRLQIFRTVAKTTGRADKMKLRTGKAHKVDLQRKLILHGLEMEKAFLFGVDTENTGENGEIETTTKGLINFIKDEASQNVFDFRTDTDFAGKDWTEEGGGEDWLDKVFEQIGRLGPMTRLAFMGSKAAEGLNKLAKRRGQINLTPQSRAYGLKVLEWVNPHLELELIKHPLFTFEETDRNMIVIFVLKNLKYRYFEGRDTKKYDVTPTGFDGVMDEWRTDCGLEFHFPVCCAVLYGVGENNPLTP